MTKKKPKQSAKSAPNLPQWDHGDWVHLMAWLDYCVAHSIDFKDTARQHLETITQKNFNQNQVESKAWRTWDQWGSEDSLKISDLYARGTACLAGITDEERQEIAVQLEQLGPPPKRPKRLRLGSAFSPLKSRSRTLSQTRNTQYERISSLSSVSATPNIPTEGYPVPSPSLASSSHHDEQQKHRRSRDVIIARPIKSEQPTHEQLRRIEKTPPARDPYSVPDSPVSPDELIQFPSSERPVRMASTEKNRSLAPLSVADIKNENHAPCRSRHKSLEKELEENKSILEKKNTTILAQENCILGLKNRLAVLSGEFEELQSIMRRASTHKEDPNILQTVLDDNYILRQRFLEGEKLRKDKNAMKTNDLGRSDAGVEDDLADIRGAISEACDTLPDWQHPIRDLSTLVQQSTTLRHLISKICATGPSGEHEFTHISLNTEQDRLEFLQAIAASYICNFAFESDFPEFLAMDPLLDKYREILLVKDGRTTLEEIDLMAHKALMSESSFKSNIIAAKSKQLADLLSEVLMPLLQPIPESESDDGRLVISAAKAFPAAFILALTLKVNLFLTKKRYHFVFPRPGDDFDPSNMTNYLLIHSQDEASNSRRQDPRSGIDSSSQEEQKVKLCIFPSLYSQYPPLQHDLGLVMDDVKHAVVEYGNFSQNDALSPGANYVLVAKSVVTVSSATYSQA